ncbi:hypothetical protein BGW37DRAFT_485937 [Umbelopsis sp. PMI_123]|nr:hypothetical protein BGW37DRAFT_485937 [Umbelopsis sp. PMI_123]
MDSRNEQRMILYTILQESFYLIFEQVPAYHLENELVRQCSMLGKVLDHSHLEDHAHSTDLHKVYLIKLDSIASARKVKRKFDDTIFYGGQIQVYYAPEHETVQDTRRKLTERQTAVYNHLHHPTSRGSPLSTLNLSSVAIETLDQNINTIIGPQVHPSNHHPAVTAPMEAKKRRRRI